MPSTPVLYNRAPQRADNETSDLTKEGLRAITEANGPLVPFRELFCDLLPLLQHISAILCFVGVFLRMHLDCWEGVHVFVGTAGLYLAAWTGLAYRMGRQARAPLSSLTNLTALLGLVVPVLRSLTESTSDNTIGPLSGLCFAINLALADHSRRPPPGTISSSSSSQGSSTTLRATLSLNGAVAGSTILASRLQSNLEAFALLFLAIGWFGALPMVKKRNDSLPWTTLLMIALAYVLLRPVAPMFAVYTLVLQGALGSLTPLILRQAISAKSIPRQRLWIEAIPQD